MVEIEKVNSNKEIDNSIKNMPATLKKYQREIVTIVNNGRKQRIQLAGVLAEMAHNKDVKYGAFGNIDIFCSEYLGIKKSQMYAMIQVADMFGITREGKWVPALPNPNGDWSLTQLVTLLPMQGNNGTPQIGFDNCVKLINEGKLDASMTVANIKDIVKEYRPDAKAIAAKKEKQEKEKEHREGEKLKAEAKIVGTQIATIEVWVKDDGWRYVIVNGERYDLTDAIINDIVGVIKGTKVISA